MGDKIMKKDDRVGFKYKLNPLCNSLFCTFIYLAFSVPTFFNNLIIPIISAFCIGFTLFVATKRYNKYLSKRYRYKIGIIDTEYRCKITYIYTNMFSISDDGTVFIPPRKRDKRIPITTVYRKDDNESNLFSWLPEDYVFRFEYNSISDNFENHIFSAKELKEMIFKIIENTEQINKK